MKEKVCTRCKTLKAIAEFGPNNHLKSGYNSACRNCMNIYLRKYNAEHREQEREKYHKYISNPNAREKKRARDKENTKDWRLKNPGKANAITAKRRTSKLQAIPKWANLEQIKKIYEESNKISLETGIKHHVDHIIPLQGKNVCGLHVENNLRIISALENSRKSNRLLEL